VIQSGQGALLLNILTKYSQGLILVKFNIISSSSLIFRIWVSCLLFLMVVFWTFPGFQSIVDGKNEEMSTTELSGGARVHYIFQAIFVKSLEVCHLLKLIDNGFRLLEVNAV
jgi:hypothetical protein